MDPNKYFEAFDARRKAETERLSRQIIDLESAAITILPVDLPEPLEYGMFVSIESPTLYYPYDRKLIQRVHDVLVADGWTINGEVKENEIRSQWSDPSQSWIKKTPNGKTLRVTTSFADDAEGSTCKRVQIGSTTKEIPVFEFKCPDQEVTPGENDEK